MPAPDPRYTLRAARPDELPRAVAIDDAAALVYESMGIAFDIADDHPFVVAEHRRWQAAIDRGELFFACAAGEPFGFFALGEAAYLDQLSVRPEFGRRGIGAWLLETACEYSRARGDVEVWLTTYAHVPWNRPFYERHGFRVVPADGCSTRLRDILAEQRAALPAPDQRVAMVRSL